MNYQPPHLGFDRFMALEWVNTALELRLANQNTDDAFHELQVWLSKEIPGKETARKTTTQIRRLWLTDHDLANSLRQQALESGLAENPAYRPLLHFGLALNIFPLFWDVCQVTGRLLNLQDRCQRQDIHQRVLEKYGNPVSTKLALNRVLQTLMNWGFLVEQKDGIYARLISVNDVKLTEWLIVTLMLVRSMENLLLVDLSKAPELLGIRFNDVRNAVRLSHRLRIERIMDAEMLIMTA